MTELAEVKIGKFFKSKELNDYAVAGIMGNLYVESGLLSDNLQDSFHAMLDMNDEEYMMLASIPKTNSYTTARDMDLHNGLIGAGKRLSMILPNEKA